VNYVYSCPFFLPIPSWLVSFQNKKKYIFFYKPNTRGLTVSLSKSTIDSLRGSSEEEEMEEAPEEEEIVEGLSDYAHLIPFLIPRDASMELEE
jgi:hypothetical protein